MKNREIGYALMRITYGVIFLFYGIGKFRGGLGNFVGGMNQQFSGKLPAAMVMPFAYTIPFVETISGALIFLGLLTRAGLTLSGLLLIGLTFGVVMLVCETRRGFPKLIGPSPYGEELQTIGRGGSALVWCGTRILRVNSRGTPVH